MGSPRSQKIADMIQREVSSLILKGLKDPRIGFVTITGVDVTADLRHAKIFITVIGEEASKAASLEGLKRSIPFLRRHLGRELRMKFAPELHFAYDDSFEYGNRIDTILKEINSDRDEDDSNDSAAD